MSDGNEHYIHLYTEILRAVLRQHLGHEFEPSFPLSEAQTRQVGHLIEVLRKAKSKRKHRIQALQDLLWALVSERNAEPWKNIFQFTFALLALRVDGTYACAANLSPELAKLKYLVHATCIAQTLLQPEDLQPK